MIGNNRQIITWLLEQSENMYEIKEHKDKRSLNANSYFYVLQNKLANMLKISNEELHFILLKRYSDVTLITIPESSDISGIVKYYDIYKKGEIKGLPVTIYRAYRPSSEMNTRQFSRLLDGIISECKEVGIETMTPEQIRELEGYEV